MVGLETRIPPLEGEQKRDWRSEEGGCCVYFWDDCMGEGGS